MVVGDRNSPIQLIAVSFQPLADDLYPFRDGGRVVRKRSAIRIVDHVDGEDACLASQVIDGDGRRVVAAPR